jgi:hypothetical protein
MRTPGGQGEAGIMNLVARWTRLVLHMLQFAYDCLMFALFSPLVVVGSWPRRSPPQQAAGGPRTRAEIADLILGLYLALAPWLVAVATWFGYAASTLQPPGLRGALSAMFLSAVAAMGALGVGWLFCLGLAMDGRPDRMLPPRRPVTYAMYVVSQAAFLICLLLAPLIALLAAILSI